MKLRFDELVYPFKESPMSQSLDRRDEWVSVHTLLFPPFIKCTLSASYGQALG